MRLPSLTQPVIDYFMQVSFLGGTKTAIQVNNLIVRQPMHPRVPPIVEMHCPLKWVQPCSQQIRLTH